MLWIIVAIVVLVLLIILLKTPTEDQVPRSSLEARENESTKLPQDSRGKGKVRKEFVDSKREREA